MCVRMVLMCLKKFRGIPPREMQPKTQQNGNGTPQQFPGYATAPRPPLTRLDSRSSLPLRPGFPPGPPRPQQIRQPIPGQQQFIQRPPGGAPRPPGQPQFIQNQARPINPNFRPASPFPRPQLPQGQPRQIFQQRSVPAFNQPRPQQIDDHLIRSQTLDSSDLTHKPIDNVRASQEDSAKSALNAMKNRSFSMSSNVSEPHSVSEEERRRSVSSIGSYEERRSVSGSLENLDKKQEDYPSRPESRSSVRMNRIMEDDDKINVSHKSPSPQLDMAQKNVDFKLPVQENKNKSPSPVGRVVDKVEEKDDVFISKPREEKLVKNVQNGVCDDKKPDSKSLELKNLKKAKSPSRSEGDNDSGVDESTQGNDQSSNGDHSSPRKSSGKTPSRTSSTTPTKNRSLSRGSKSPSLKSPDSTASTPGTTEKKKVPMNKIQVGSAPSPNLKVVRSKIGSLENASYKPGGGKVKIESKKLDFKKAAPRIEAKNEAYTPKGGDKKIQQQKLQWNAKSKVGSLENATHKPKGGDKKIETVKLDFKDKAKPKVGSKDNIKHVPGGGDVKFDDDFEEEEIENKKLDLKVQSKVGSLDNVKHKPGGGDKRIFDDKEYLKQRSAISSENHSLCGSQKIVSKSARERYFDPSEEKARILETVKEEVARKNRPTSAFCRSGSLKVKKSATPRPPWRF
ncbi:microtubule-associated protein 2 isoform X2 [Tribolium castaneum]|uniref:microtubule-associated protein 2 isoform X2 n=1 Tax=Tribolium castaneum TaxID=7070 RepID=UPI00077DB231|nr:PREDICTED: microtubule-associated protein 2 isoform X2 [Tribolium castaneum]|eukprot:XP_015840745.1 PREDICTED: microtubule-associated protein 2 isoform X2 [Tribolium castaneum]